MASFLSYTDESGKEAGSRTFILATVTFETEQATQYEERIWQWRAESEAFTGKEIKLRKILERPGFSREKLDAWSAILRDSGFRWFLTLIPLHLPRHIHGKEVLPEVVAGVVTLNRLAVLLEARDSLGSATFDQNIAEPTLPRMLYDAKLHGKNPLQDNAALHWRRIVGQLNHAHSNLVPELWIADGIAYLIHRRLNRHQWRRDFDEVWSVIRDKVWLSPDGQLSGWGLDVYAKGGSADMDQMTDLIEAEAVEFIMG